MNSQRSKGIRQLKKKNIVRF